MTQTPKHGAARGRSHKPKWAALRDVVEVQEAAGVFVESVYRLWAEIAAAIAQGFHAAHRSLRPRASRALGRPSRPSYGHVAEPATSNNPAAKP